MSARALAGVLAEVRALEAAIRQAAGSGTWARGRALSDGGAVRGLRHDEDEAIFEVRVPTGVVALTVTLWPDDEDWDCDCDSGEDVCTHAAAAVMAWRGALEAGDALPGRGAHVTEVGYRFTARRGALALRRVLATPEGDRPLPASLEALREERTAAELLQPGWTVATRRFDLDAERLLEAHAAFDGEALPKAAVRPLLETLDPATDVTFEGAAVRASGHVLTPRLRLRAVGPSAFVLEGVAAADGDHRLSNGAAVVDGLIRPTAPGVALDDPVVGDVLSRPRRFEGDAVADLVGDVLPALKGRVPLERVLDDGHPLPECVDAVPRLVVAPESESRRPGAAPDTLTVASWVAYVDADGETLAEARIDGGGEGLRWTARGRSLARVPRRDRRGEARLAQDLERTMGLRLGERTRRRGPKALDLAERVRPYAGAIVGGEALASFERVGLARLTVRAKGRDRVRVGARLRDGTEVDPRAALDAWARGWDHVPLTGGGWAALPTRFLERHGARLMRILEALDAEGRPEAWARPELAHVLDEMGERVPAEWRRVRKTAETFQGVPEAALPADLQATLRPYQRDGVNWLMFCRREGLGSLLADDMGLGKTLQAACVLERGARSLVVAPTSVVSSWRRELARFRPALRVGVYRGTGRQLDAEHCVTLTSYAILRQDADALLEVPWHTVVLDEAQRIKNPSSQVARAAHRLQATTRVALSGTPVENRLEELWSLFGFVAPGLLGSRGAFQDDVVSPIRAGDGDAMAQLRRRTRPFVLRRTKREVASDLPPRQMRLVGVTLDEDERGVYDALQVAARATIAEALGVEASAGGGVLRALEALTRLRQAACHPGLVPGVEAALASKPSSKVRHLVERLEVLRDADAGHRALVFSQWTSLLDRIEPALADAGLAFARIDGATPAARRQAIVEEFQAGDGPDVVLLSLRAAGTGLTLTAADHVFLCDPWWNPAVEDQAADRAHRIGQTRSVFVHRLVAEGTVEERIVALQESKRALADAIVEGGGAAGGLTRDDLLALLDAG